MNKIDAIKKTRALLDDNELGHVRVVINPRLTTTFGRYRYRRSHDDRWIELAGKLVELNSEERVTLTIIHEVAHALTEGHGHDDVWRAKCIALGGDGKRTYDSTNVNMPTRRKVSTKRYTLECAKCPYKGVRVYNRKQNNYIHRGCGGDFINREWA